MKLPNLVMCLLLKQRKALRNSKQYLLFDYFVQLPEKKIKCQFKVTHTSSADIKEATNT